MVDETYILTVCLGDTGIGIGTDALVLLKLDITDAPVLIGIHNPADNFAFGRINDYQFPVNISLGNNRINKLS